MEAGKIARARRNFLRARFVFFGTRGPGFEPGFTAPKAAVLPLYYPRTFRSCLPPLDYTSVFGGLSRQIAEWPAATPLTKSQSPVMMQITLLTLRRRTVPGTQRTRLGGESLASFGRHTQNLSPVPEGHEAEGCPSGCFQHPDCPGGYVLYLTPCSASKSSAA